MNQVIVNSIYKHYKNKYYKTLYIAKHTETNENLVIYKALYNKKIYARPLSMFIDKVNDKPRFEFITKID